jgi:hypothetical protein
VTVAYLKGQRLARIATVSPGLQPDVAPVSFDLDEEHFYVGGLNLAATLRDGKPVIKKTKLRMEGAREG